MRRFALPVAAALLVTGCVSHRPVERTRIPYNEAIKTTNEEQLLLNIVRLRYSDTPSSLAVSSIAAQFELQKSLGITPFFAAQGAGLSDQIKRFTSVLPNAQITTADRPTISFTPMDDTEFTRRLFTPLTLESILYLAKTTWPIATVFRLYLENLNWIPNAELASGPTPRKAPAYGEFLRGVSALQRLQDRGWIVFGTEERAVPVGQPMRATTVRAADAVEAARHGFVLAPDASGQTWTLTKKESRPVLHVSPEALGSAELADVCRTFRLKPGLTKYDVTLESLVPFSVTFPPGGVTVLDLETRSLLQTLFFVSHGVEVPPSDVAGNIAPMTKDESGRPFDWNAVLGDLFRVRSSDAKERPANAHVAVRYLGHWFWIEQTDHTSKSTFSLILELSRLELTSRATAGPVLTLPIGGQ